MSEERQVWSSAGQTQGTLSRGGNIKAANPFPQTFKDNLNHSMRLKKGANGGGQDGQIKTARIRAYLSSVRQYELQQLLI